MSENDLMPQAVLKALEEPKYYRAKKPQKLIEFLDKLQINHPLLRDFYEKYEGPLWSDRLGLELLDPIEGIDTVESETDFCRSEYHWPQKYIVLTKFSVGQVVALDQIEDKVYEIDFQGGELLIKSGELPIRWKSLADFLGECFEEKN